jgi:hypothetical protein
VTTKPTLQKILQGVLHTESETQHNHERADSTKLQKKRKQESRESHRFRYTLPNLQTTKTTKWQESPHTYQY